MWVGGRKKSVEKSPSLTPTQVEFEGGEREGGTLSLLSLSPLSLSLSLLLLTLLSLPLSLLSVV